MKVWLISLSGLFIFIVIGLMVQNYLNRSATELNQQLAEVEPVLFARQWDQALIRLNSVKKRWVRTKPFWAVLTNHKEIDLIEEALIKTVKAISSRSYADAWIELGMLRRFTKHIPEKERFNLENIF